MASVSMLDVRHARRARTGLVALLLAIVALLAGGVPSASAALTEWSPRQACPDVLVIGARGTGQEDGQGGVPANSPTFGLGTEVYGFATHLAARWDDKTVAAEALAYPAIPLSQATDPDFDIFDSIDNGRTAVRLQVAAVASQCRDHHTKIVLAGYSQGAAAVRKGAGFVQQQDSDMVAALVLIADPYNNPNGGGFHLGSATSGHSGLFGPSDSPAYLKSRTVWVCNDGDLVCDSDSVLGAGAYAILGGSAVHTTSYQDANLQVAISALVAATLNRQTGAVIGNAACWSNTLPANDDSSTGQVDIGFTLNFFGQSFSRLYVNNNGNVTFDGPLGTYTPFQLNTTNREIIAPFFADVDTRGTGSDPVTYGYGSTTYQGHPAFCVNWVSVGYYAGHTDKLNSLQLLLVDRSDVASGDFDIVMNYDTITWETGDASGGSGGLGGASARVGYSNGVDRSFELPGSGTNGALLDSNLVSGLVHSSRNSSTPGRYVFHVRSGDAATGHQIAGSVLNDNSSPPQLVSGAYVSACSDDGTCALTTSSASGVYAIGGLADGHYTVSASPPGALLPASATATVAGSDVNLDLHVTGPVGPPLGTSIGPNVGSTDGLPVIYWSNPTTLQTSGCAGATATYTVTLGSRAIASGSMSEGPTGHYSATIPPFYPDHGNAHVRIALTGCAAPSTVNFDIYIDPSGTVEDTAGHPIADATVTLLRSGTADGPFVAVEDGSAVMALSNRNNPATTDANGHFGWDVIPGFYKVRAQKEGCHAPGDASTASVETAVLTIPPPVTDLVLTLECAAPDLDPPEVTCEHADDGWHAANVGRHCTAVDARSGLASTSDADFTLSTHVAAGEETAGAATDTRIVCDRAGNCASAGPIAANKVDRKAPSVTIGAPLADATFLLGQQVAADYGCQDGGSGVESCTGPVANGADVDTGSVGHKTFQVQARDRVGNTASPSSGYDVVYDYSGFFAPVDNPPTLNTVKAGSAIPVKFSLHGNQGLGVLAQTPSSEQTACDGSAALEPVETPTSSQAGLTYDPVTDQYVYVWKTASAWAGSCRALVLRLNDGTVHRASFKFR